MQKERYLNHMLLVYIMFLLIFAVINVISSVSILDVMYLIVVICCVFKYLFVIHEVRK